MGRKNRVRHGQLTTDIETAAEPANVPGDENRSAGSAALEPAQPSADAGDGSADADLLGVGGIDGGDQAAEADPVSVVGQAGQPAEEQAEEVTDGKAQETPGDGGEDPAASGSGGAEGASGEGFEPVADKVEDGDGDSSPDSGGPATVDSTEGLHSGKHLVHEGAATADVAEPVPAMGTDTIDQAEPIPTAQAWRPHTVVEKAGMTAAASMNEAFWALDGNTRDAEDRLHGNYALWRPAADFVIANRDAPAEAIAIHLAMKKIGGTMTPKPVEVSLWNVFKTVFLLVHDALVVELARQAAPAPAEPAPSWPGDRAMQPQAGPFDATGYFARR